MSSTIQSRTGVPAEAVSQNGGAKLGELLDYGQSTVIALMGDSTGNATTEWFYTFGQALATDYPTAKVEHLLWNDGNQSYDAATVIQAGSLVPVLSFSDDMSGTSADVVGRTPVNTGSAWTAASASANGDWSVSGGNLIRSADTTVGFVLFGGGVTGDQTVTLTGMDFSTVGDGAALRNFTVAFNYVDASNYLNFQIRVTSAGVATVHFFKMIGGVQTQLSTASGGAGIPNSTASVTGNLVITRSGLNLSATFGATTLAATILQADADAVASSTHSGLGGGNGNLIGMTIGAVQQEVVPTDATIQTITMYNGSMPGSTLAYQSARLAEMIPVAPNVLMVSSSHNYTTTSGADYYEIVSDFCESVLSMYPDATVALSSQNPEKPPATNFAYHAERCQYLRQLALDNNYGYIPAYEDIIDTANWQTLVDADGFHPTTAGSVVWKDAAVSMVTANIYVTP